MSGVKFFICFALCLNLFYFVRAFLIRDTGHCGENRFHSPARLWNQLGSGKMAYFPYPSEGSRSEIPKRKMIPIMKLYAAPVQAMAW